MDYRIEHALTEDILRIAIFGVANDANANMIAQEIFRILDRHDVTHLLVDVRNLKGRLGPVDTYWHVQKYPRYASRIRAAIVDLAQNRPYDLVYETMCKNRGYNVAYFESVADAEQWLST